MWHKWIIFMGFVWIFFGCNDDPTPVDAKQPVVFKGAFEVPAVSKAISDIGDISQIVALALDRNGDLKGTATKKAPVQSDGTFSIELDNEHQWLMMREDLNATSIENRIAYFLSLSEENTTRLSTLPLFNATGTVDAGLLTPFENETLSSVSIGQASAALGESNTSLLARANYDNINNYLKNEYINNPHLFDDNALNDYDGTFSTFFTDANFHFVAASLTPYNTYINPAIYVPRTYMSFPFGSKHPEMSAGSFTWVKPDGNRTAYTTTVDNRGIYYANNLSIDLPAQEGYYRALNDQNVTFAAYDLFNISLYDKDGNFTGLFPTMKLNIDANATQATIDLAMTYFNKALQQYAYLTDSNESFRMINQFSVSLQSESNSSNYYKASCELNNNLCYFTNEKTGVFKFDQPMPDISQGVIRFDTAGLNIENNQTYSVGMSLMIGDLYVLQLYASIAPN